jgi:hypothetical protein
MNEVAYVLRKQMFMCFIMFLLLQSCCDYLSCQGKNAETVWMKLINRVHPVPLHCTTPDSTQRSENHIFLRAW